MTTSYVLVLNVENKAVLSFLDELQKKLRQQVRLQLAPAVSCCRISVRCTGKLQKKLRQQVRRQTTPCECCAPYLQESLGFSFALLPNPGYASKSVSAGTQLGCL